MWIKTPRFMKRKVWQCQSSEYVSCTSTFIYSQWHVVWSLFGQGARSSVNLEENHVSVSPLEHLILGEVHKQDLHYSVSEVCALHPEVSSVDGWMYNMLLCQLAADETTGTFKHSGCILCMQWLYLSCFVYQNEMLKIEKCITHLYMRYYTSIECTNDAYR